MHYGLGVDLGTTFASAAISGPAGTRMVPLAQEIVVPSVAYRAPSGPLLTGAAALAAASDPARIARGFKRRLGDPTPFVLSGSPFDSAALMAAQLRDVLTAATQFAGSPATSVVLTCPAIWGPYRREHFTEVPRLANLSDFRLITEPEAAATHYSSERRLGDGEVVAVYDLGGGTFDMTILRMRNGRMEILGTPEGIEHMGGMDFDETLLAHLDQRLDGAISQLDPADPDAATALARIRASCVRAKEELSVEPDVRVSVPLPSGPREVMVTRREFNEMIRPSVQTTTDALRHTISSANLRTQDLSAILLAGGSSRIPLVSQLVSQEFGKPVRVTLHPKFTVALGAAAIAARPRPARSSGPVPRIQAPATPLSAAQTPPPVSVAPSPRAAKRRSKWLVPALATATVAIIAVVTGLLASSSGGERFAAADLPPLQLYADAPVSPYQAFVADPQIPTGTEILANGAKLTSIAANPQGPNGLEVSWAGDGWGQVYLQTLNQKDLSSYVASNGALVFDVVMNQPPDREVSIQAHCTYPCVGKVLATSLFQHLPVGQRSTVRIPLACFTAAGLDPKKVNTPFLVYTEAKFDATFSDIRWEAHAGADATPCQDLR